MNTCGPKRLALAGLLALLCAGISCASERYEHTLTVTATAFNSVEGQTSGDARVAAWGDTLRPGMKAIAVSRDLIPLGLDHQTQVKIKGLPGEYVVLDKLAPRWEQRIDIYMGQDRAAARDWGRRDVVIHWGSK